MIGRWNLVGIAALVATALLTGAYQLGKYHQRQHMAVEAAQSITKAIQDRVGINEKINDMDSIALYLELGGLREQCEQLRRVGNRSVLSRTRRSIWQVMTLRLDLVSPGIIPMAENRGAGDVTNGSKCKPCSSF